MKVAGQANCPEAFATEGLFSVGNAQGAPGKREAVWHKANYAICPGLLHVLARAPEMKTSPMHCAN